MAYSRPMVAIIDALYPEPNGLFTKRMFGSLCYFFQGNMAFGVYQESLIVRLGSAEVAQAAIKRGEARPMDLTGRSMKGWVIIPQDRLQYRTDYQYWLDKGLTFAQSLPPK